MKVKGFAAFLAVLIGLFGYSVVDKDYVTKTESELSSYEQQVESLNDVSKNGSQYERQISSLQDQNNDYSKKIKDLEKVSKEYASHTCTSSKVNDTTSETGNNPASSLKFSDLKVGTEIPVSVNMQYIHDDNNDYIFTISNAKAIVTEVPSSSYVTYKVSFKLSCTRKVSTYFDDYTSFRTYYDIDGRYGLFDLETARNICGEHSYLTWWDVDEQKSESLYLAGAEGLIDESSPCEENGNWVNNTISYNITETEYIYSAEVEDRTIGITFFAYDFTSD